MVGTAGKADFGSGQLIHYLLLSEQAKWPQGTERALLASLLPCVPDSLDSLVVHESTFKGLGGMFYDGYWKCKYFIEVYLDENHEAKWREHINEYADPMNEYTAIFFPWFVFKKYRMQVPPDFKKTKEEEERAKAYNLTDEQLAWYRWALPNKCHGDLNIRRQEYPHTAKEAAISSGTPSFNVEKVIQYREAALKFPPVARYNCILSIGQWIAKPDGELLVWEEPRVGVPYLISADVAEGLEKGDFNSASVWNHHTGFQVAHYHGHMDPYDYATFLNALGLRYNMAWVVPERNNHGRGVIDRLQRDFQYKRIYVEKVEDPPHRPRKRFGWVTSVKSRPLIIDWLKYVVHLGTHGIRAAEMFTEMLNFKKQADGKEEADPSTFDDRVIDAAIGKYCLKTLMPVPVPKPQTIAQTQTLATRKGPPAAVRRSGRKPDMKAFS